MSKTELFQTEGDRWDMKNKSCIWAWHLSDLKDVVGTLGGTEGGSEN